MNIKKIFILIFGAAVLVVSCKKLNAPPTDSIDPTKAFRNMEDLSMGVLGAYSAVTYSLMDIGAIVSDEVMLPTENTVSNTDAYRWLYNSSYGSVTGALGTYYQIIDRANRVIQAVPGIPVTSGSQSLLNQYHGEMLALRAYSHFELVRAYASSYEPTALGMPYMKKPEVIYPARNTVASNFEDINADLIAAKDLIPAGFSANTRITRNAISAIQARVALYEKNWTNAITYATEVITKEPLAPKNDFAKIWPDQSNAEVVWQLSRVIGDSRIGAAFFRQTGEIALYVPAFKLLNLYDRVNDIRFAAYITYNQARQDNSAGKKSAYLIKKYDGGNTQFPGLANIKLFRTGEMYLIRAEAALEKNSSTTDAAKDLNDLRRARIFNYTDQNFADKQTLLTDIYNERFKELAFEGHRFFDLKRRYLPVERPAQDAINASGAVKLDSTKAQYVFPISAEEMSVNKNMKQNPKYSER